MISRLLLISTSNILLNEFALLCALEIPDKGDLHDIRASEKDVKQYQDLDGMRGVRSSSTEQGGGNEYSE